MNKLDGYNNDGFPNFLVCITKGKVILMEGPIMRLVKGNRCGRNFGSGDIYFHSTNTLHGVRSVDYKKN